MGLFSKRKKKNKTYDDKEYNKYYDLLNKFDNVMINRANKKYEKEHPNAKPHHSEHGWYLSEDDN